MTLGMDRFGPLAVFSRGGNVSTLDASGQWMEALSTRIGESLQTGRR